MTGSAPPASEVKARLLTSAAGSVKKEAFVFDLGLIGWGEIRRIVEQFD
jgi:hypothetical protein